MSDLKPKGVTWRRLARLALPQWRKLALASVALLISSALSLVFPTVVQWMVDAIVGEEAPFDFNLAAIVLLGLFAVQAVFSMIRSWLFTVSGERIVAQLRADLFESIVNQDLSFFDETRTGELTNRLSSDTTVLQNTVTVNVSMALRFTVGALGGVFMLLYMSPKLTGLALAVVPVVAIGAAVYGRAIRKLSTEVQDALASSTEVAEETIGGIRTVRAFAGEGREVARYQAAVEDSYLLAARRALAVGMFSGVTSFAGYSAIALVVWYGGSMVQSGEMTIGALTAFLLYTLTVAFSLGALSSVYGDFMRASGASVRVFELIDRVSPLEMGGGAVLGDVVGKIELRELHFSYPSREDIEVLSGINLLIEPGHSVALVGASGSGKSTVAALISRFYDPDDGEILIDDQPLTTLDPRPLREHIGVVSQEPILFATSIAENIRYGHQEATDDEVFQAASAANALEFVEGFPEGFETAVGERGVRLSGGQKQRIAIARALLQNPKILILDEATSALDTASEHLVQEALDRLMKGRTTLIIAHRLSTVRDAGEVVVLHEGRIVERGTHEELLAKKGRYSRLVERQFDVDDDDTSNGC